MKYLGVIYALLFGYFLFGELYSTEAYVGMMIVVLGVVLNIWYKHRVAKTELTSKVQ